MSYVLFWDIEYVLALATLKLCVLVQIHALKIDSDTGYYSSLMWALSEHIFPLRYNNANHLGSCQNDGYKQRNIKSEMSNFLNYETLSFPSLKRRDN